MHYFFKPHELNFKEWVKSGFEGIPERGIAGASKKCRGKSKVLIWDL